MAMVDYGAVVFKNGVQINTEDMFMDMQKAVGWSDDMKTFNHLNGSYYAYVGDENLTFCFYKNYCVVVKDKEEIDTIVETRTLTLRDRFPCEKNPRVYFDNIVGTQFRIKRVTECVFHFSMNYKGDHYHVIYGYGIDNDMEIWNDVKNQYLGKKAARKVDNLYARIKENGRK